MFYVKWQDASSLVATVTCRVRILKLAGDLEGHIEESQRSLARASVAGCIHSGTDGERKASLNELLFKGFSRHCKT